MNEDTSAAVERIRVALADIAQGRKTTLIPADVRAAIDALNAAEQRIIELESGRDER